MLVRPLAVKVRVLAVVVPAVTALFVVIVLEDVRLMVPVVVETAPLVRMAPVLLTLRLPPLWVTPVIVSVAAVLVRSMSPEVVLVALNEPTVLAPLRVEPPAELVVRRPVVLTRPAPDSTRVPEAVRLTPPPRVARQSR